MESKEFGIAYNNLINDSRFANLLADSETLELFAMEVWNKALEDAAEKCDYPYKDKYGCSCDVPSIILSLKK